ncbi:MAG: DUF480 domain-containing protein [Planctomycetes bacterium]|nr:DUF480 domain-containing protein [Planctomycetota bacterium]
MHDDTIPEKPRITELSSRQRRVLGVLVEKGFTTPEYYPLTLKAVTSGCNQKSNRDPHVGYSEDDVFDALEELRELGLAAVVHTESGRTERFRHYMRRRLPMSEPQLAILTELLLRGRQQMGELRSRANRMVPIDGQDSLREALRGLRDMNFIQSDGPLERRGVDVDHNLYPSREAGSRLAAAAVREEDPPQPGSAANAPAPQNSQPFKALAGENLTLLQAEVQQLRMDQQLLRETVETLQAEMQQLSAQIDDLRRDLGG